MMRQAARILTNGGSQQDVIALWEKEGVKVKTAPPDPAQATQQKGADWLKFGGSPSANVLSMHAIQGVTFGFGDEAIGSILGLLTGEGAQAGRDIYRSALEQGRQLDPSLAGAAEFAGGMATGNMLGRFTGGGRFKSLAQRGQESGTIGRTAMVAGEAGAAGGLAGAGAQSGGLTDRAKAGILSGVIAATTIGTGTTLAKTAGTVTRPLVRGVTNWAPRLQAMLPGRVSVSKTARELWAEALAQDGISIPDAIRKAEQMSKSGVPVTLADVVGENGLGLMQAASGLRGPAKQKLVEELVNRQAEQGPRMLGSLFRSLKLGLENAYDAADDLMANRKAAAATKYAEAYLDEVPLTPEVQRLLNHPVLKEAYEYGRMIAADEDLAGIAHAGAKKVPALTINREPPVPEGYVRLYRGETTTHKLWAEDSYLVERNPKLREMREGTGRWFSSTRKEAVDFEAQYGKGTGNVMYVDVPALQADRFRVTNQPGAAQFSFQPDREFFLPKDIAHARKPLKDIGPGRVEDTTLPVRALDYMKRGLDVVIERKGESGRVLDEQAGRSYRALLNKVLDEVGNGSPAYKQAREVWKHDTDMLEALQLGKGGKRLVGRIEVTATPFHAKAPEVVKKELASLTPAEQELYRLGAAQDMADWVRGIAQEAPDVARRMFGGRVHGTTERSMELRVKALFQDPGVAEEFMDYVRGEARVSYTKGFLGGSRTAPLQSAMAELEGAVPQKGGIIRQTAGAALMGLQTRARTGWTSAVSDELANGATKGLRGKDELVAYLLSLKGQAPAHRAGTAIAAGQAVGSRVTP
jgi:hypothetical protein